MEQAQESRRDVAVAGTLDAEKLEAVEVTLADRLRALEKQCGATSERWKKDGRVYFALIMADGDRIAGSGATTADAIAHLEQRVEKIYAAEG